MKLSRILRVCMWGLLGVAGLAEGATVITFGGSPEEYTFVTDSFVVNDTTGLENKTLSDGYTFTLQNNAAKTFWTPDTDNSISGTWTNSAVVLELNEMIGTGDSFKESDFSAGTPVSYTFTGSSSYLSVEFNYGEANIGNTLTMYVSATAVKAALSSFEVEGLDNLVIYYASNNGTGFSSTESYSTNPLELTLFKVVGTLKNSIVTVRPDGKNQQKAGIQMIAYTISAPIPESGAVALFLMGIASAASRRRR